MKKRKVLVNSLLIVGGIMGGSGLVTEASSTGSTTKTDINISAEATTINMTVPSQIGMIFNADGTNTLPDNFNLTNESSLGGIYLSDIQVNAGSSGWRLADSTVDIKEQSVDTKDIRLKFGTENGLKLVTPTGGNVGTSGSVEFGKNEVVIPAQNTLNIKLGVERGAFSTSVANAKAFDIELNFDWVTESSRLTTGSDFQTKIASLRSSVHSKERLVLVNSIDESKRGSAVDVSADGDGSVIAYNDAVNSIALAFEGVLELNSDSAVVFRNFTLVDNSTFDLNLIDFSKVVTTTHMFDGVQGNIEISNLVMPNVEDASYMFANATMMGGITNISLPRSTTASNMFYRNVGTPIVSDIYLPSATTANNMFRDSVIEVISDVKFSDKLKSADYMFTDAHLGDSSSSDNRLDMSDWGMSGVTQAKYMFSSFAPNGSSPFTIKMFDTSGLTDGSYLFDGMLGNINIDLSYNNFDNLEKADYMFNRCMAFTNGKFIFENVSFPKLTSAISMFDNAPIQAGSVSNLSFPVLKTADRMFGGNMSYSAVDLSSFSFGSLVSANNMINGFMSATSMDLSSWDVSTLTSANNMISNMNSLKGSLGISSWDLSSLVSANNLLNTIPYLENDSITIRNKDSIISLSSIGMGTNNTSITVNYIDDETKAVAEKLVADTANDRIVLGTKVQ